MKTVNKQNLLVYIQKELDDSRNITSEESKMREESLSLLWYKIAQGDFDNK